MELSKLSYRLRLFIYRTFKQFSFHFIQKLIELFRPFQQLKAISQKFILLMGSTFFQFCEKLHYINHILEYQIIFFVHSFNICIRVCISSFEISFLRCKLCDEQAQYAPFGESDKILL